MKRFFFNFIHFFLKNSFQYITFQNISKQIILDSLFANKNKDLFKIRLQFVESP